MVILIDSLIAAPPPQPNQRRQPGPADEQAIWLDLGLRSGPVFSVLHRPLGSGIATAVLCCPPFGWREECAHRGIAIWARALAAAGFSTLRIDLPGTRNSGGDHTARSLPRWRAAVAGAAAWLRAEAGVERVTLLGIEFGGLVGCTAIADGAPIDDLILWSVPSRGQALVRELKMQSAVISARHSDEGGFDPDPDRAGLFEAVGFVLEEQALTELAAVRLTEHPFPEARTRRALLLGRDGQPSDAKLERSLQAWGVQTSVAAGPGYAELTEDPQYSRAPGETIATTIAWLERGVGGARAGAVHLVDATGEGDGAHARRADRRAAELVDHGTPILETAVQLEVSGHSLFAIVSTPAATPPEPLCGVLLNSGSLSHVGPNRAWVELARRWAAAGVTTVRLDLPGIGETEGDGERFADTHTFYADDLVETTVELLDRLEQAGLPSRFALVGLCSGAYWALRAALRDQRVAGALLLNLWAFQFTPELAAEREPGDALSRLRHRGLLRLLRGDVNRNRLSSAIRSVRPGRMLAGARHEVERSQLSEIVSSLEQLTDRGTEVTLLFGLGEPMERQLERLGLMARLESWPHLRIDRIPSRDHMFRAAGLQRHVHARLDGSLQRILEQIPAAERSPLRKGSPAV